MVAKDGVRRDGFPQLSELREVHGEAVTLFVVGHALLGGEQPFPALHTSVNTREPSQALRHESLELPFELVDVLNDLDDALVVKGQCLSYLIEDSQIVDDEAVSLARCRTVRPTDGLKQRVVSQQLVQVHALEIRSIKAGEQLRCHDEDLEWVSRVAEAFEKPLLLVLGPPKLRLPFLGCPLSNGDDYSALDLGWQHLIECSLVEHTGLLVDGHDLGTEAFGSDLLLEVSSDVLDHSGHARWRLDQEGEPTGPLGHLRPIFFAEILRKLCKLLIEGRSIDPQVHRARLEPELECCLVPDGLLEAVATHVATGVLWGAEGVEGIAVPGVDGCPRQPEQERVWKRVTHLAT